MHLPPVTGLFGIGIDAEAEADDELLMVFCFLALLLFSSEEGEEGEISDVDFLLLLVVVGPC